MTEPVPPPGKEKDDSLEDLDLPFLQAVALQVTVLAISLFTRVTDVHTLSTHRMLFTWDFETVWVQEYRPRSV